MREHSQSLLVKHDNGSIARQYKAASVTKLRRPITKSAQTVHVSPRRVEAPQLLQLVIKDQDVSFLRHMCARDMAEDLMVVSSGTNRYSCFCVQYQISLLCPGMPVLR